MNLPSKAYHKQHHELHLWAAAHRQWQPTLTILGANPSTLRHMDMSSEASDSGNPQASRQYWPAYRSVATTLAAPPPTALRAQPATTQRP